MHDTIIKTQEGKLLYKNIYLSLYCKGSKRIVWGFTVRGSWRWSITAIFWPPQTYGRQRCVFLVLQGYSTGGPGPTLLGDGFLYCILSASSLDPNSSGPQAPSAWYGFTYHISSPSNWLQLHWPLTSVLTVLYNSSRPLDLWNRMFNRHQAEISVMQFRGHSLPVHHSVVYHGNFFCSSHFISPRDFLS